MVTRNYEGITSEQAYSLIRENGHTFFGGMYVKKDGSQRKFNGRMGVRKHLKGGELKYSPSEFGYVIYWDRVKGTYRTLNTNTLTTLRIGKKDYFIIKPNKVETHYADN